MTSDDENISSDVAAAMAALYRKLDDQLPEGQPGYDVPTGLGKVFDRLKNSGKKAEEAQGGAEPLGESASRRERAHALPPEEVDAKFPRLVCAVCSSSLNAGDAFCQVCGQQAATYSQATTHARASEPAVSAPPPNWSRPPLPPSWSRPAVIETGDNRRLSPPGSDPLGRPNNDALGNLGSDALDIGPTLDPVRNQRFLREVVRRLAVVTATAVSAVVVTVIIAALLSPSAVAESGILAVAIMLVCGLGFLFVPVTALVGERSHLVPARATAARDVFGHMVAVLNASVAPFASLRVSRWVVPYIGTRDYLQLRSGLFTGYVSCFPYGSALFTGWTYWVRMSPARLLFMYLSRLPAEIDGRSEFKTLLFEPQQALAALMHTAVLEGMDVAIGAIQAQGQGIVGSAIPWSEHKG